MKDIKKAAEYFTQAIEEDRNFALGYVGLADCRESLANNWGINMGENHRKARRELAKSLEIDKDLAEAHATRGLLLLYNFDLVQAEEELKRAIELKPSYPPAYLWYFHILRTEQRWNEALEQIEEALELDPFSQVIHLNYAAHYYWRRDYRKALELLKQAVELNQDFASAHFQLSETYGRLKMFHDSRREAMIGLGLASISKPQTRKRVEAMLAYFEDDREKVERLLPNLAKHVSPSGVIGAQIDAYTIAGLYFFLGQNDTGFRWLGKSFSRKEPSLLWITNEPFFDNVRSDSRYLDLLKKLRMRRPLRTSDQP
ncbi:MAG TPA: tetratricopeptide repeat protein [Candidatus Angelobacter sp.]|nr:tetratricopeptide repeat protein [Candidatus Angelobacter sp.]